MCPITRNVLNAGHVLLQRLNRMKMSWYTSIRKPSKTQVERAIEQRLLKNANIVLSSGKKAVIALSARGVGPENTSRILLTLTEDDDFYREIMKAERNFIQTHRYLVIIPDKKEKLLFHIILSSFCSRKSSPFLMSSRFLPPVKMIFPEENRSATIFGSLIR